MTPSKISSLLVPYKKHKEQGAILPETLLSQISTYLDLLLRWNARTNLTALRAPEEIVTRHFGESLFAASHLFPEENTPTASTLADIGSGAGFPGLPIKLWAPHLQVTLVESHNKKATFLREVIRTLRLTKIKVQAARAETITQTFDTVTLRAVERFDRALITAAKLVCPGGRLALLVGEEQIGEARTLLPVYKWDNPQQIPNSHHRVLLFGASAEGL
jgi:16S rRNA (guanine527-N7)-methyltransferase